MEGGEYEELMKQLKQKEYIDIYKVNLCFVCSNSIERPCYFCGRLRFTHLMRCLDCCGEGGDTREDESLCINCDLRTTQRPCSNCALMKHILLPSCLHCNGELSEGETGERDGEKAQHSWSDLNTIQKDRETFILDEFLEMCYTTEEEQDTRVVVGDWINIIDLLKITAEYKWAHHMDIYRISPDEWGNINLLSVIPEAPSRCNSCNGVCVCIDPDINYNPILTDYTNL